MYEDAGRVQGAPEPRRACALELGAKPGLEIARVGACSDLLPGAAEHLAGGLDGERIVQTARQLVHGGEIA